MKPANDELDYLQGQIDALKHIVLGLAALTVSKQDLRTSVATHLEHLKTGTLYSSATELRIKGADSIERFFDNAIGDD